MWKVKCGMETAEWQLLVHRSDHMSDVTASITQFTARPSGRRCGKLRNVDVQSIILCMLP